MHAHSPVLSNPALRASLRDGPYSGIADGVRVWTHAGGVEATAARFVRHRFSPHTHDTLMMGLIEKGSKTFRRERRTHVAPAGSISVVNPGDLHTGAGRRAMNCDIARFTSLRNSCPKRPMAGRASSIFAPPS